jgi:hypothetical protein
MQPGSARRKPVQPERSTVVRPANAAHEDLDLLTTSETRAPQAPVRLLPSATRPPSRHILAVPDNLAPSGELYLDFFRFVNEQLHPQTYFEIGTHQGLRRPALHA